MVHGCTRRIISQLVSSASGAKTAYPTRNCRENRGGTPRAVHRCAEPTPPRRRRREHISTARRPSSAWCATTRYYSLRNPPSRHRHHLPAPAAERGAAIVYVARGAASADATIAAIDQVRRGRRSTGCVSSFWRARCLAELAVAPPIAEDIDVINATDAALRRRLKSPLASRPFSREALCVTAAHLRDGPKALPLRIASRQADGHHA